MPMITSSLFLGLGTTSVIFQILQCKHLLTLKYNLGKFETLAQERKGKKEEEEKTSIYNRNVKPKKKK